MKCYFKELLIIIYALIGSNAYYDRIIDLGFSLKGVFFVVILLVCLLGLILTSYIKNHALRIFYALIIFSSSVLYLAYGNITADHLSYNAFISIINARGFAGAAFEQFYSQIITSVFVSLLLFMAISLKPKSKRIFVHKVSIFAPVCVVFLLTAIFFLRGGRGGEGVQSPFIPLAYAGLAAYEASNSTIGERKGVQIRRVDDILIDYDIVLIIDESISPSYLDINSKYGVLTNLKNDFIGIHVFNYGYAAAITNCSYGSNLTLRYGGTRDGYLATISTMPSIWQYAKKANFHTVYIDAQRTGMNLQNGMTDEEKVFIDEFIQFNDTPVVSRDIESASKLIKLINNETHDFIIVNKIGAHFPVHDKYPNQFELYKPALPRGRFKDITDTGSREGFSGKPNDWLLYRNSYRNTLLWGVGHFFNEIVSKSNLDNAVIIYTSDHGQDLHENGSEGLNTHCSSEPRMDEGMVPLVILQGRLESLNWNQHIMDNKDKSSHYNIFPTLLSLMKYEPVKIKSIYGNSLHLLTNDDSTFNTLFNARLGRKAKWTKIEPENVIIPPEHRHTQENSL